MQGKKIAAALGAVALMISMYTPVGAVDGGGSLDNFRRSTPCPVFSDVADDWTRDGIEAACELALMKGTSGTTFSPSAPVTVQEAVTIAARMNAVYSAGSDAVPPCGEPCGNEAAWATPYISYALDGGLIQAGDFSDYTAAATRAEMAYIFAHALPADSGAYAPRNLVDDGTIPDVETSDQYGGEIYVLYRAGIVTGGDGHSFGPDRTITRAETAAIVSRLPFPSEHKEVSLVDPPSNTTSYLADGVTAAPWQGHIIYVGTATKTTAGQPRSTAKNASATSPITVRYGFHNYNSNTQAEYDTVIKAVQSAYDSTVKKGYSALVNVINFDETDWQVVDNIINGKSYDAKTWNAYISAAYPAIANNISDAKTQAETLKLYAQYRKILTSIKKTGGESGAISAYDILYNNIGSCVGSSHLQTAIADMLGIDCATFASKTHQASVLKINGVYFDGEMDSLVYGTISEATTWADQGQITEWTSSSSPLK